MADRPDVPPKLFFRIGEVAGLVGVEPHVLRYWEREFRSIRPTKSAKGQRVYSRKDVENLLRVRDLLYRDGFTIAGAKKKLQRGGAEPEIERALARHGENGGSPLAFTKIAPVAPVAPEIEPVAVSSPAPSSPAPSSSRDRSDPHDGRVREKLTALRAEVEAFLAELSKRH